MGRYGATMELDPTRRRLATVGTLAVALVAALVVVVGGDRPRWRTAGFGDPTTRGAVAFRDQENAFFQWGTELYLVPLLEGAYGEVAYVTQRGPGDLRRLARAIEGMLQRHTVVDLFLAVHGGKALPHLLADIDPALRARLRLVYSTGCGDGHIGHWWLDAGADAFVGHDGQLSISPIFLVYFMRRWSEGHSVATALAQANAQTKNRLALVDGLEVVPFSLVDETTARALGDTALSIQTHQSKTP